MKRRKNEAIPPTTPPHPHPQPNLVCGAVDQSVGIFLRSYPPPSTPLPSTPQGPPRPSTSLPPNPSARLGGRHRGRRLREGEGPPALRLRHLSDHDVKKKNPRVGTGQAADSSIRRRSVGSLLED